MAEKHEVNKALFSFWVYLMTDLIMFSVLFAAFAVLRDNTFGGATISKIFNPPFVLIETLILLTSSFTVGITSLYANAKNKSKTIFYLLVTGILGLLFLGMEFSEFSGLISEGNGPQRSAFLSSFFTLVGTHGLHITGGIIWISILLFFISKRGITESNLSKIKLLSLFWHFLDIVWIFIFTIVYLFGGIL